VRGGLGLSWLGLAWLVSAAATDACVLKHMPLFPKQYNALSCQSVIIMQAVWQEESYNRAGSALCWETEQSKWLDFNIGMLNITVG
jgi:hypothetical protein